MTIPTTAVDTEKLYHSYIADGMQNDSHSDKTVWQLLIKTKYSDTMQSSNCIPVRLPQISENECLHINLYPRLETISDAVQWVGDKTVIYPYCGIKSNELYCFT